MLRRSTGRNGLHVHRTLVGEPEEQVARRHGGVARLLRAEDEVNPLVEVRGDVLGLERLPHPRDEGARRPVGPRREHDVPDARAVLPRAEVQPALLIKNAPSPSCSGSAP